VAGKTFLLKGKIMFSRKKWLVTVLVLCYLGAGSAVAATSDTFQITVTCNFISINLRDNGDTTDYTTWAIGQQATSAAVTMAQADGILVDNTSNVATNLSAWISTPATNWAAASSAGADEYKLELKSFDATEATPDLSSGTTTITATSSTGDVFKSSLDATTDQWVYGKFTVPTSTTSGAQQTITVTILASAA
jgi:hypothetical protein